MKTRTGAYLTWLMCIFGLCGVHRLYLGRWFSGLVWMGTFGLFGLGQLADWRAIPWMVHDANAQLRTVPSQWLRPAAFMHPVPLTTQTVVREVVKIRCSYCRMLRDEHIAQCPRCGAEQ